jgi:hypothetical protein
MTAKWEKMHAKEAKKAEKSKMPQKAGNIHFWQNNMYTNV